jgi:acetyl-CoA acyltransferase
MKNAVIVAMGRSAIGKAGRGTLRSTRPEDIAAQVLRGVLAQVPALPVEVIEDVIVGCAFPEAEQGMNVARIIALKAGLGDGACGQTVNRFCASGLQAIATASAGIMANQFDVVVAGGVESMSIIPMGGNSSYPNPGLLAEMADTYIPMGITAENVAEKYRVSRQAQDEFALRSHQLAQKARSSGRFAEEIIPVQATLIAQDGGSTVSQHFPFDQDEGIRENLAIGDLEKLRPTFKVKGSVTAGNASQTSDGAAFVVLMSEAKASEYTLRPIASLTGFSVAGVEPGIMGIGPVYAIPKVLKRTGLSLKDIDLFELNEAFASQAVACVNELGLSLDRVNVNGGAIALGHPLGCTGALLTVKLLHELRRRSKKRGIVSMCIGTGMGAAGVFELRGDQV